MNKVINKYLIFGFLKIIFITVLIFICLGIILNLFEEIEFFKGLDENISLPFLLTVMFIPNLIVKLLPFIIFIASMWYLISIKSNGDLLSLKVFGFSNLKIILILSLTAFLFGVAVLLVINPLTSTMIKFYEETKAQYSKDIDHLVSINKNGVWIKEIYEKNLRITTAKKVEKNFLKNLTIYELDKNTNKILYRIEAKKAEISTNTWKLESVKKFNLQDDQNEKSSIYMEDYKVNSIYNIEKLNNLYRNLDTISFLNLVTEYNNLNDQGYSKQLLNEKLNSFLSLPIFLFLMVVLASIFTVSSINKPQNLYYIFISIICCVVIYYFKDLSVALGQTNRISLTLAVWIPVIAISLFCSIGIIQINEK
jgi:lipopolysaccharide export system permease protein